jgi:tetratricopeptide (TPR) repeat protein
MEKKPRKKPSKKPAETLRADFPAKNSYLWLTGILILTFIVFIPAIKNLFITFDDGQYVNGNKFIQGFSGTNLKTILFEDANNLGNYHPLTLLTYMVNYAFSELNPTAFHLTNILIHLFNTFLVFQLAMLLFVRLRSDSNPGLQYGVMLSSLTALLFGIHPLHVESVAWVAARKDLLYTCFYLLSLMSYIRYLNKKSLKSYYLALVFFVLSLLSKGMAVTLSLSVVALDYFYRRDLMNKSVILEKIPFFLLSLIFGIIAIMVQQAQGATDIVKAGFLGKIVFASFGLTQYLIKLVLPYKLCGYYPYPDLATGYVPGMYYFSLIPALAFVLLLFYYWFVRPDRKIVFGMLFFILNVLLVLQLFPVGSAVMADRYTYLSSFGIFFLMALGFGFLLQKFKSAKVFLFSGLILYVVVLSAITFQRCMVWHDSRSFWTDVMVKYPHFYPAINNLGLLNEEEGKKQEAVNLYTNSIKVNKNNPNAYFNRGSIYGKSGQLQLAISDFDEAIKCSPGYTKAYINRAIAKAMKQDYPGALADLDKVLEKEKNEEAYFNRGILKNELKEFAQAIPDFQEAIKLNASCSKCYYSLGLAYYFDKNFSEAVNSFSTCIALNPTSEFVYYYRALSYKEIGKSDSCCNDLQKALKLGINAAEPLLKQYCPQ